MSDPAGWSEYSGVLDSLLARHMRLAARKTAAGLSVHYDTILPEFVNFRKAYNL
jgi:hypothetical protein